MKVKYKRSGGRAKGMDQPEGRPETDMEYNKRKAEEQKEIDKILEKISKSGYDALSKAEKEILFRSSKK